MLATTTKSQSAEGAAKKPLMAKRRVPTLPVALLGQVFEYCEPEWGILMHVSRDWNRAVEHVCSTPKVPTSLAVVCQTPALVQWAIKSGCPKENVCANIVQHGSVDSLVAARGLGCPWGVRVCALAAAASDSSASARDILQWSAAHDCPWDATVCAAAAGAGALVTLQWLRANDCPWDQSTTDAALAEGHYAALLWAMTQECPMSEATSTAAADPESPFCQWLQEKMSTGDIQF